MSMMTKYADNMEDLVAKRTRQLEVEQKKTDDLLCRMLPRYRVITILFTHSWLTAVKSVAW